ncbi:right-handed parallel beta-helix repeat-containing protein [Actinomycetes bacterium KLBMP 9797]
MTRHTIKGAAFAAAALIVSLAPAVAPTPGYAVCAASVRYAATTNAIYLTAPQPYTLTAIKQACPSAPLAQVDPAGKVWQLNADLVLQNGSTLVLHGGTAGDVNALRLRSLPSNKPTEVSQVMANHGTIDIKATKVTSWDPGANGPDTNVQTAAGGRGRAFIRAISTQGPDGAARESRLNIVDSELSYLGYYGAESYGVAYKSRACTRTTVALCAKVKVSGAQINSRFHHNFMGTYAWGARDMTFRGNTYSNNVSYGLDPHDVSSNLVIERNTAAHNGSHGIICSQLCDRLRIVGNASHDNGHTPWAKPGDDPAIKRQVHGIMLHRGITNTLIADNRVWNHPNGAGIAVFDSSGNTLTRNRLDNNMVGIRLSVGSAKNVVSQNTVRRSAKAGLFMYKGNDPVAYTTASGRPTGNVFDRNVFEGGENPVKVTDSDATTIAGGAFIGRGPVAFVNSTATIADPAGTLRLDVGAGSTVDITSRAGRVLGAGTTVTPGGSRLRVAGPKVATVTLLPLTAVPSAGTATASPVRSATPGRGHGLRISGLPAKASLRVTLGGLWGGVPYSVRRGATVVATVTASRDGVVRFTDAPPTVGTHQYSVAPR